MLDRLLEDQGIAFPHDVDPRKWKRRRGRRAPFGFGVAAAAAALIAVAVVEHPASVTHALAPKRSAVESRMPAKDFWQLLGMVPQNSVPLWTAPRRHPLREILYMGHAQVQGFHADQVVAVDAGSHTTMAVGFQNGEPAWVKTQSANPVPVSLSPVIAPAAARWQPGGGTPLASFAAAGSNVYVTNGAEWALLTGAMNVHWAVDPASDAVRAQIQALPDAPQNALLLTESANGDQRLFLLQPNHQWQPVQPPATPITQLVGLGHQYWALANGTVYVSTDGRGWTARYTPPNGFSVATFAVSERAGHTLAAVSLSPIGQPGVGPVYLSANGGFHWRNIGVPWPNGSAPAQLVVTPTGSVAALLAGPPVVIDAWVPAAGQWQLLSLPHPNPSGVAQLTAFADGDLLYADGQGNLYRYLQGLSEWQPLPAPPGVSPGETPNLMTAIGDQQVLLSYREGWGILVLTAP